MIELTLPYPISANRYWRTYLPRGCAAPVTTVSPEAQGVSEQGQAGGTGSGGSLSFSRPGRGFVCVVSETSAGLEKASEDESGEVGRFGAVYGSG